MIRYKIHKFDNGTFLDFSHKKRKKYVALRKKINTCFNVIHIDHITSRHNKEFSIFRHQQMTNWTVEICCEWSDSAICYTVLLHITFFCSNKNGISRPVVRKSEKKKIKNRNERMRVLHTI